MKNMYNTGETPHIDDIVRLREPDKGCYYTNPYCLISKNIEYKVTDVKNGTYSLLISLETLTGGSSSGSTYKVSNFDLVRSKTIILEPTVLVLNDRGKIVVKGRTEEWSSVVDAVTKHFDDHPNDKLTIYKRSGTVKAKTRPLVWKYDENVI